MHKVVAAFGLSGVGKSWMISRYAAASNVAHIQASQLLRDARAALVGRSVTSENLLREPVLPNQTLLIKSFVKLLAHEPRPIIFDGHVLIDTGKQIIEIPFEVIRQLQPTGIVLIRAPAEQILKQRESDRLRERPVRTVEELAAQQDRCEAICASYADRLAVPFRQLQSGDEVGFSNCLLELFQKQTGRDTK